MARALENYAILGDHNEGTPNYKGDKALRRAIQVLESVREEGQDKAQWNMRMAYAYQYLYGQEERPSPTPSGGRSWTRRTRMPRW